MKPTMERLRQEKLHFSKYILKDGIYGDVMPLNLSYARTDEPVPFAERFSLTYKTIPEGEEWSGRVWDCAWFHIQCALPADKKVASLYLALDFDGEGCVYTPDGVPVRGITNISSEFDRNLGLPGKRYVPICECLTGEGGAVDLWADVGNNDLFGNRQSGRVLQARLVECDERRRELFYDYAFLLELADSLQDIDPLYYTLVYALEEVAVRVAHVMSAETVEQCESILRPHLERKNIPEPLLQMYAIGHSHLDLAWKWPLRETRRKAIRTFSTALANLRRYPEYVYGASQPQQFAWVKEDCPALFKEIQAAVAEGRFELQGGMWVEADTNLSGGEALIRQFLYGKRFWREEFGKGTRILWLPDVFGFSASLPQIMRGCGCDRFLTIKLSWNMVNEFPHHSFRWKGIDGSEVLVHMPPEGTYNSSASPKAIRYAAGNYAQRGLSRRAMMLYGIGDGGGGPGRSHLEFVRREKDIYGVPNVVNAKSEDFFDLLDEEKDKFPVYQGEIYLEKHQGTYTSQAKNKYYNRKAENALALLEFSQALTGTRNAAETEKLWKEVLLYQFHDILPGSSIKRVYDESVARYEEILRCIGERTQEMLFAPGGALCAVNYTSFARKEYVRCGKQWYLAEAEPYSVSELKKAGRFDGVYAEEGVFGNEILEVKVGKDGSVLSVYDKKNCRQALRAPSGILRLFADAGDAWDFYFAYAKGGAESARAVRAEYYTDGPRAGVRIVYAVGSSSVEQDMYVEDGSPLLRFDLTADWRETEKMLRMDFYPNAQTDEVTCDIQMGSVRRQAHDSTAVQQAQYEVCAHKWVDMSQEDYGVALLNDGKYGYRCKDGCISANLLRSQSYPCEEQDKGQHRFSFALYPHAGGVYGSAAAKYAYALNRPLFVVQSKPMPSLIKTSDARAVVETVKPAEDGNGFIARLYNDTPAPISVRVETEGEVSLTDMLENGSTASEKTISLRGFEIVTLRVTKQSAEGKG